MILHYFKLRILVMAAYEAAKTVIIIRLLFFFFLILIFKAFDIAYNSISNEFFFFS